jgi:hypothetical protein
MWIPKVVENTSMWNKGEAVDSILLPLILVRTQITISSQELLRWHQSLL